MKTLRLLAASAWLLALSSTALAATAMHALDERELSQVHAAGLPEDALRGMAMPSSANADALLQAMLEQGNALERQQALAQMKLGAGTARSGTGLLQDVALAGLFTPVAPIVLPVLALPFPFLALPPSQPQPPKH